MPNYSDVNAAWPAEVPTPTPQEALSGARRLVSLAYRLARQDGKIISKRTRFTFKAVTGNRHSYPRRGVVYVNPKRRGSQFSGWPEIVHGLSHWAARRWWSEAHGSIHAWIESEMVAYAVKHFLAGQLARPEKPKTPAKALRAARIAERIKLWESKRRRAETALRKLRRQARYYEATAPA